MDMEVKCDCGNPKCNARTDFRKGYIHITHPDGRTEERWDWFHIFSVTYTEGDEKSTIVELMVPPKEARRLMWFLVRNYLPGVSPVYEWCSRHIVRNCVFLVDWFRERLGRSRDRAA